MFYRRKILLALLQLFDNELDKIRLQKLLFLFTQQQTKKDYDFVPYKFGCFSYSANADLTAMAQKGILLETEKRFSLNDKTDYLATLREEDKLYLQQIKSQFSTATNDDLIRYTYIYYPYWATKSTVAKEKLSANEYRNVMQYKPHSDETILFTIGYEGVSLEEYLNRLIRNDVRVLVDVRRNPLSMKYGFSKSQLMRYCDSLDIEYLHLPEVGIASDKRQELNTQADYDKLFASYRETNLSKTIPVQKRILELLQQKERIALTCFEANIAQCHRKHLADAIVGFPEFHYELKHI